MLSPGDRGLLVHDADRHVCRQPVETAAEVCVEGQASRLGEEIVDGHVHRGLCARASLRGPVHPVDDRPGSLELHPERARAINCSAFVTEWMFSRVTSLGAARFGPTTVR